MRKQQTPSATQIATWLATAPKSVLTESASTMEQAAQGVTDTPRETRGERSRANRRANLIRQVAKCLARAEELP